LAGLPRPVIQRAYELLNEHNGTEREREKAKSKTAKADAGNTALVIESLTKTDINQLSPVEALTKLYELQRKLLEKKAASQGF
jgi:DNA mismatch repair protein MutS